jgi:hypothetical protein
MKLLISEKAAELGVRDKKRLKKYWKTIYPKKYVDVLVSQDHVSHFLKSAKNKTKDISLTGTLKQDKDGFVYIDIPDDLVFSLFDLLDKGKAKKPPYFGKNKNGAHVSVIYRDEVKEHDLTDIKEIGKEYDFKLGKLKSVDPDGWNEMSQVYFLEIKCPELSKIRQRYGLPKYIHENEFHITFGIEKQK